jgi:VIT1/CCC1 family predicted Fe2+/Mn2+ transporter
MDEERLHYMGALILGLNDAIIEITGAIAGFTFALQSTTIIALAGLITGVAGTLSMASSEYLEKQSETNVLNPVKATAYTGGAYLITGIILVAPYLMLTNYLLALVIMLLLAFVIIFFFSFYSTFIFDQKFRSRFPQMLLLSFGVAFVSFLIGSVLRVVLHVNM